MSIDDIVERLISDETYNGTASDATHYQKLQQQPIEIMQKLMTPE